MLHYWKDLTKVQKILIIIFIIILIFCLSYNNNREQEYFQNMADSYNIDDINESFEFFGDQQATLTLFYAPWCGHCEAVLPTWDKLMETNKNNKVKITKINCDKDKKMAKLHNIEGFPTIKLCKNGVNSSKNTIEYNGNRTLDSFVDFIKENL